MFIYHDTLRLIRYRHNPQLNCKVQQQNTAYADFNPSLQNITGVNKPLTA